MLHRKKEQAQLLGTLRDEVRRIEPYGSFEPAALRALAERGIHIRLYHAARGVEPAAPADAVKVVLRDGKEGAYFVVISRVDVQVDATELRLPEQSLDAVRNRITGAEKELAEIEARLKACSRDEAVVADAVERAEETIRYLEAKSGMGSAAPVAYLQGFCPVDSLESARQAAAANGWGLVVEEPGAEDAAPTLIRNPRWIRPIETLYRAFGILPGYAEIDVSAVFLTFMSIFFAMIVGDAGYGLVFFFLTRWARKKFPALPERVFSFLTIMSVSTIVWGVMTGSYFFIPALPAPFHRLKVEWLANEDNVKYLSFLLGAIHLSVAHLWNTVRWINSPRAIAQVGWICTTWTMFFAACTLVLGMPFPSWVTPVGVAGTAAIILFMTPVRSLKTEWFNHALLPLTLVGNFIDVVSYIRLYAVGVAGAAIAASFTSMALSGVHGIGSGLVAALILFFAHALNIVLSSLGVLVHGVRLNVLEFTNHIGMQWSGFAYEPFSKNKEK